MDETIKDFSKLTKGEIKMDDEIRIALVAWINMVEKSIHLQGEVIKTIIIRIDAIEKQINKTMDDFLTTPVKSKGEQPA